MNKETMTKNIFSSYEKSVIRQVLNEIAESFAYYNYSSEKYELATYPDGEFFGKP